MKILVAYYSRKGYTALLAEELAKRLGADTCRISTTERTHGLLGFMWCGRFGMHRWPMPLRPVAVDVSAYDKVIFCSPVWVFTVSAPMRAFLSECAGRVKSAEYMLVHYSFPMKYERTVTKMDEILKTRAVQYQSVCCVMGRVLNKRSFRRTQNASL